MARARATTILSLALALLALGSSAGAGGSSAATPATPFGPNVKVFDPSMPVGQIHDSVDAVHAQQVNDECTEPLRPAVQARPSALLDHPPQIKVGYYTEVAWLGASPTDVVDQRQDRGVQPLPRDGGTSNCLALVNFWRTLSNLTLNINSRGPGRLPRVGELLGRVAGSLHAPGEHLWRQPLTDGLLHHQSADLRAAATASATAAGCRPTINGSQQQWLTRNSELPVNGWTNGVWNQVFSGVVNAPSE